MTQGKLTNTKVLMWVGVVAACSGGMVLLLGIVSLFVASTGSHAICRSAEQLPATDVALVLGTSRHGRGGRENPYFNARMQAAARLYHSGKVKKLLLSGDNSAAHYNEPRDMEQALLALGVPPADLVLDYAGFRTFDSVLRCRDVFGQRRVVVVSQRFHLERALHIAHWAGLNAHGYVAEMPSQVSMNMWLSLRETGARLQAMLDCHLLNREPKFLGEPVDVFAQR